MHMPNATNHACTPPSSSRHPHTRTMLAHSLTHIPAPSFHRLAVGGKCPPGTVTEAARRAAYVAQPAGAQGVATLPANPGAQLVLPKSNVAIANVTIAKLQVRAQGRGRVRAECAGV